MTSLRILIAEDDAIIAMCLEQVLLEMGHQVCAITRNEADTIAAGLSQAPDLLIVDAGLSEGSGLAAVDEILKSGFVPHVFATGDFQRVLKHNPNAVVLQKPYDYHALARAIERAVLTKE
jgi:two-component system, response regulator PdtaR